MRIKQWLAGCVSALVLLSAVPFAGAADDKAQARQEDLDKLVETLITKHPDFYANTSEQAVAEKKTEIEAGLAEMSDLDFAIALSELTALAQDSHTMLAIGGAVGAYHMPPVSFGWYDGRWTVTGTREQDAQHIGKEVTAINGFAMDEVAARLSLMISHDNAVFLRRQLSGLWHVSEILQHYGIVESLDAPITLTLRNAAGKEEALELPQLTREEMQAQAVVTHTQLRKAVPPTEPERVNYKLLDLGKGVLYMQYNRCADDPKQPMAQFAAEVQKKLESGDYAQFVIDMRYNGGGSDGVLYPVVYQAQQFIARGKPVYVLAGEGTFSSALINTVQLKEIGATVVGTPTGGSVDHFGAVSTFELPHSQIGGQYSNKFIDMSVLYDAAKPYGVESFPPDIMVEQGFTDYINGIDTPVQYILTHDPVKPVLKKTAQVSQGKLVVDGKPVAAAAYKIEGSNYFKLRDLAMAFAGSRAAFQVTWDQAARKVLLSEGAYTPVGGELAPLQSGSQTAVRATAAVYIEDMPLVGKAYEIGGSHYFKLRDLCMMLGVSVEWDADSATIHIDTAKPYLR